MAAHTIGMLVSKNNGSLEQKKQAVMRHMDTSLRRVQPLEALEIFFDRIPVSSIPTIDNTDVVEVTAEDTIRDALKELYKNNAMFAPVRDSALPADDCYVGVIDFVGLILWAIEELELAETEARDSGLLTNVNEKEIDVAKALKETSLNCDGRLSAGEDVEEEDKHVFKGTELRHEDFFGLLDKLEKVYIQKVSALTHSFRWAPFLPVGPDNSFLHVILLLSKHNLKAVPVVNSNGSQVTGFITQLNATQLLLQCDGLSWFDSIAQQPLRVFRFEAEQLAFIYGDEPLLEAFHRMWRTHTTGLPVLYRETNCLFGVIHLTDAKLLLDNPTLFKKRRLLSAADFLKAASNCKNNSLGLGVSSSGITESSPKVPQMLIPVTSIPSDTLKSTMEKLVVGQTDPCFVVDEKQNVTGVVTLRDIITQFAPILAQAPQAWGDFYDNALQ